MSTIGIDFGRTATVAFLCDGQWPGCHWRMIGDGARIRIPNAADDSGRWGSAAIAAGASDLAAGNVELESEPWLDDPLAQVFWKGLADQLTSFLGRVEPVAKNGYRVLIAPQSPSFVKTSQVIQQFCRRGVISALDGA